MIIPQISIVYSVIQSAAALILSVNEIPCEVEHCTTQLIYLIVLFTHCVLAQKCLQMCPQLTEEQLRTQTVSFSAKTGHTTIHVKSFSLKTAGNENVVNIFRPSFEMTDLLLETNLR